MRKTKEVKTAPLLASGKKNRDAGKTYVVTELSARAAEKFAVRIMQALGSSGVKVPAEFAGAGVIGVLLMGYQALMGSDFQMLEPLMDEMLERCVKVRVDGESVRDLMAPDYDGDFEEVETLLLVRREVLELHAGFTFADAVSRLKASAPPRQRRRKNTQTSPA